MFSSYFIKSISYTTKTNMADYKKSDLNGAYYGPSIPPKQSYHRPGRGGGGGCCVGCLSCLGCCVLSLVLKIVLTICVVVGLAIFIFWLILRPNNVKFHVTDASLTQFNLTADNTLNYNLALNITVRNPNKRIGIYYDRIEARAYYEDQRFSNATLTKFYQGHKTTNTLNPTFTGQQLLVLEANDVTKYNTQKSEGVYSIDLKLYLRIRFKVGVFKTGKFKPKIECDLKVPLTTNSVSAGSFEPTKCHIDF